MQESILEIVEKKLELRFSKIKYGNHLDKCNDYGPMSNFSDLEVLEKTMMSQIDEFGSNVKQFKNSEKSPVFPPTIVKNVALNSQLNLLEVNGPYLMLIPFRTVKESSLC